VGGLGIPHSLGGSGRATDQETDATQSEGEKLGGAKRARNENDEMRVLDRASWQSGEKKRTCPKFALCKLTCARPLVASGAFETRNSVLED